MLLTPDGSAWQLVALPFGQDTLAASQTDVALVAAIAEASQAVDGYVMPWDFIVLGMSMKLSAAGSAGSLTLTPTIDGTKQASTTSLVVTTATKDKIKIPRSQLVKGAAGSDLGIKITTTAGWNGTTADLLAILWAMVRIAGI